MKDPLHSSIFGSDQDEYDRPPRPAAPTAPPRTRREMRERELSAQRRRGRDRHGRDHRPLNPGKPPRRRRFGVLLVALLLLGGGAFAAFTVLRPVVVGFFEPNDYDGPGTGSVTVTVEPGDSGMAIARTLLDEGVIKSTKAYVEAADENPRSTSIQPGVYELRREMTAADAIELLADSENRITTAIVIPEGLWASEVFEKLSEQTGIPVKEYAKAAEDGEALGLPAAAKGNVEGYLFPARYTFDPETTAEDHLKEMVANSVARLEKLGVDEKDMEHVVIVASLVEAEARLEEDRPKVARVVENRLEEGMRLQFDSTVNYATGEHGITTSNEARADENDYNTYKITGLPAGPIGNPGESAIKAAAEPADGDWLFFVTVDPESGETRFAETYAEHQKNVALFQSWCQEHKGTC